MNIFLKLFLINFLIISSSSFTMDKEDDTIKTGLILMN